MTGILVAIVLGLFLIILLFAWVVVIGLWVGIIKDWWRGRQSRRVRSRRMTRR
jgi:threonine/homoserine/homoserine lactone efflux protein